MFSFGCQYTHKLQRSKLRNSKSMLESKIKLFYDFIFLQIVFVINFVRILLGINYNHGTPKLADGVQPL